MIKSVILSKNDKSSIIILTENRIKAQRKWAGAFQDMIWGKTCMLRSDLLVSFPIRRNSKCRAIGWMWLDTGEAQDEGQRNGHVNKCSELTMVRCGRHLAFTSTGFFFFGPDVVPAELRSFVTYCLAVSLVGAKALDLLRIMPL